MYRLVVFMNSIDLSKLYEKKKNEKKIQTYKRAKNVDQSLKGMMAKKKKKCIRKTKIEEMK